MCCTKQLIETVKSYPVLYNPYNADYKNNLKREKAWEEIGKMFKEDRETVKKKWRNVRDSYIKHLRRTKTANGKRRCSHWQWAKHMEEFKPFFSLASDDVSSNDCKANTTLNNRSKNEMDSDISSNTELQNHNNFSNRTCEDTVAIYENDRFAKTFTSNSNNSSNNASTIDKMNSLRYSHSGEPDATDLIFLGYAKTIKNFSVKRQAQIKLEIAQIIMQHEIANEKQKEELISSKSNNLNTNGSMRSENENFF